MDEAYVEAVLSAVEHLLADGVPLTGRGRVDMSSAVAATPLT